MAINRSLKSSLKVSGVMDQVASITRASWSRAMSTDQWLGFLASYHRSASQAHHFSAFSDAICDILIRLITATAPPSNRLLSYYLAAVESGPHLAPFGQTTMPLVTSSKASIRILEWLSEPSFDRNNSLETLNLLAKPLVAQSPSIVTYDPPECLYYLDSVVNLFNSCRPTSSTCLVGSKPEINFSVHQLAEALLSSLSPCLLSIPRNAFLQHPHLLNPLLEKLTSRFSSPDQLHIHSEANKVQFPSILRHLSPLVCKTLVYSTPLAPVHPPVPVDVHHPLPSNTSSAIIAHTLLTPGASALQFDADGQQVVTPLITRIVGLALTYLKRPSDDPRLCNPLSTLCRTWLLDLLLAAVRIGHIHSPIVLDLHQQTESQVHDESNTEDDKISWKALLGGGRLAELIRFAISSSSDLCPEDWLLNPTDLTILRENLVGGDLTSMVEEPPLRYLHRVQLWSAFLSSLQAHQLIGTQDREKEEGQPSNDGMEVDVSSSQHSYNQLELGLDDLLTILDKSKETPIAEIAAATKQALLNASWSFDLSSLTTLTKALTGLDTLCTIFLWLEPKDLLEPVKGVLDRWESARDNSKKQGTMDESEGSSGFEKFGTLLGWVQGVVGRFGLMSHLPIHLGSPTGFTIHYLLNPSCAYPLASLSSSHSKTLASWIEALYGSSGISDDLLTNTDPRIFFTISASIFKQSFDALRSGLIDLQTFREGLSYFEQELLIAGCAVGVVGWLIDELSRVGPVSATSYPTALLDILQAIILSDAITPTAISLIAAKSLRLLRTFNNYFVTTQASLQEQPPPMLTGQATLVPDLPRSVQLDITRLEEKLTAFPFELVSPNGYLSFNFFNTDMLVSYGVGMGWEEALNISLRMAITGDVPDLDDHPYHTRQERQASGVGQETHPTIALWSLLPYVLKSVSVAKFVRIVLTGICGGVRVSKPVRAQAGREGDEPRLGKPLEKTWSIERYERMDRALELAVDIFTWPFEQVGAQLVDFPMRRPSRVMREEEGGKRAGLGTRGGRPKLVGTVLEEVFLEWGVRIGAQEDLEDAELEREVVIGCLDRLTILESTQDSRHEDEGDRRRWSQYYRRMVGEVLKEEMKMMKDRAMKTGRRERGMKMMKWIEDGLMIDEVDGQVMGLYP